MLCTSRLCSHRTSSTHDVFSNSTAHIGIVTSEENHVFKAKLERYLIIHRCAVRVQVWVVNLLDATKADVELGSPKNQERASQDDFRERKLRERQPSDQRV